MALLTYSSPYNSLLVDHVVSGLNAVVLLFYYGSLLVTPTHYINHFIPLHHESFHWSPAARRPVLISLFSDDDKVVSIQSYRVPRHDWNKD